MSSFTTMVPRVSLAFMLLLALASSHEFQHKEQFAKFVKGGCPASRPPSPDIPKVPTSFVTRLEVTMQEEGHERAFSAMEMFDANTDRGVLDYEVGENFHATRPYLLAQKMHYSIDKDEVLVVTSEKTCDEDGDGECTTNNECYAGLIDTMSAEMQELFGIIQVPGEYGFFGAAGILQFGSMFNYTLAMEVPCHGMRCQVYQTCMEKEDENATALFTYAWSKSEWSMEGINDRVPVYLELMTTGTFGGHTTKVVMMRYDFFDFQPYVTPSDLALQPPATTYCVNRTSQYRVPDLPPSYTVSSELELQSEPRSRDLVQSIYRTEKYFDSTARLSRFDHLGHGQNATARYLSRAEVIYDFNMGLAFYVQPGLLQCLVQSIPNKFSFGTVQVGDDGLVSMVPPTEQEILVQPFQYNGRHVVRGAEVDVWVGVKRHPDTSAEMTHVWYYATDDSSSSSERPTWDRTPLALDIRNYKSSTPADYRENFFNFVYRTPHSHRHDVSLCYKAPDMRHFKLDFPADTLNRTKYLREHLMYGLTKSLAATGQVSPLRINRPELVESSSAVSLVFTVLEVQSVVGNSATPMEPVDLASAVASITSTVEQGKLEASVVIPVGHEIEVVRVLAVPGSLKEIQRDDGRVDGTMVYTGYSSGSMAGLGIGMLILGAGLLPAGYYLYSWWKSVM